MTKCKIFKTRTKGCKYYNWRMTFPKQLGDKYKDSDFFEVEVKPYGEDFILKVL